MKTDNRNINQNHSGWIDLLLDKLRSNSPTTQSPDYELFEINGQTSDDLIYPTLGNHHREKHPSLLSLFTPLPPYSGILGVCNDGLPLVMDLTDPSPGAILISGPRHSGKTQLLKSILLATSQINSVDELIFYVISPQPDEYREVYQLSQCMGLYSAYDRAASELIVDLAALTEQRRSGRHLGAKTIVVVDNLDEFLKSEEFEVFNYMSWMLKHGARNGVWLIASISSNRMDTVNPKLLAGYSTRIESGVVLPSLPERTLNHHGANINLSYRTMIGNQWVYFWLPSS